MEHSLYQLLGQIHVYQFWVPRNSGEIKADLTVKNRRQRHYLDVSGYFAWPETLLRVFGIGLPLFFFLCQHRIQTYITYHYLEPVQSLQFGQKCSCTAMSRLFVYWLG